MPGTQCPEPEGRAGWHSPFSVNMAQGRGQGGEKPSILGIILFRNLKGTPGLNRQKPWVSSQGSGALACSCVPRRWRALGQSGLPSTRVPWTTNTFWPVKSFDARGTRWLCTCCSFPWKGSSIACVLPQHFNFYSQVASDLVPLGSVPGPPLHSPLEILRSLHSVITLCTRESAPRTAPEPATEGRAREGTPGRQEANSGRAPGTQPGWPWP